MKNHNEHFLYQSVFFKIFFILLNNQQCNHYKGKCWQIMSRGQQRYIKNVTALYVVAFGLFSERNFKKQ